MKHIKLTPRNISIDLSTDALYDLYEHGNLIIDNNSGVIVELKIPSIVTQHLERMGLSDDEDLMKIIADSAQELGERGYVVNLFKHSEPLASNEPQGNDYKVTALRSVNSGSDT